MSANWFRNDHVKNAQFFRVNLPAFQAGNTVEYYAICQSAGRQVPSQEDINKLSSFRVIADEDEINEEGSSEFSPGFEITSPRIHDLLDSKQSDVISKDRILSEKERIRELQHKLRVLGFYNGELTSDIDTETQKGIAAFRNKNLDKQLPQIQTGSTSLGVDPVTVEAINKEYELIIDRMRFGIPSLDSNTISRLRSMGIYRLGDISQFDTEPLHDISKLDRELLTQLRIMAEISNFTGLRPRNAYALVEIGDITSYDQFQSLSEEQIRHIFETAINRGMLSDSEQIQLNSYLSTVVSRSREIHSDLRRVFPSLDEDEARKLASASIVKGSDLRSMNPDVISRETGLRVGRLEILKNAGQLIQIPNISPEIAIVLEEKGKIGGIPGLANVDPTTILDLLKSYIDDGILIDEVADLSEAEAEEIIETAQIVDCSADLCSSQEYLSYLRRFFKPYTEVYYPGAFGEPEDLDQTINELQEFLSRNGISHKSKNVWCYDKIARRLFPENYFDFRLPLLRYGRYGNLGEVNIGEFEGLGNLESLLNTFIGSLVFNNDYLEQLKEPVTVRLNSIRQVMTAENETLKGHTQLQNFNPMGAISFYSSAVKRFVAAIPIENNFYDAQQVSFYQKFEKGPFEEILSTPLHLIEKMADFWQIDTDETDYSLRLSNRLEIYEKYRDYNPSGFTTRHDPETGEIYEIPASLEELQYLLPHSFGTYREKYINYSNINSFPYHNSETRHNILSDFINYVFNDAMASIMHYTYFILPLSIGDALTELGHHDQGREYYNSIYNFYLNDGYDYLNHYVDLPHLKMRMGSSFIEDAEFQYRENSSESIVKAKYLYEKVLDFYDDCIPNNINQFDEMSLAIDALLGLNYDDLPSPSALRLILKAVSDIQNQSIPFEEILHKYRSIQEITQSEDKNQIASKLSEELNLDIRYSAAREVFTVINISSSNGVSTFDENSIAESAITSTPCKIPCNPVIEGHIQKARMRLSQINRGLNILGYSDDEIPFFRYQFLINQAKWFVNLAITAEKDFIQFLSSAEAESFNQLTAQQAVSIAVANVRLEQARAGIALQRIELAKLQKGQTEREITNLTSEIKRANHPIFEKAEMAQAYEQHAAPVGAFGVQFGTIGNQWLGGGVGIVMRGIHRGASSIFGREPPIETQRRVAKKARKNHIKKLEDQKKLLEDFGLPIADKQIAIAIAEHELTQQQVAIAQLGVTHAQQILNFLQTKLLNKDLWYELAKEIRAIYRKLLDYAISTAFLAEQALEYEMNQRINVIRFDYYKPDREGLLGAENLQADIATLEYQKIALTENKKVPVKAVISLGEEYPQELLRFTSNGRAHFTTDFRQFDLLYPGTYQSRISRVEVVIEGLVPPEGVHGTHSTSGISYVRTRENQIVPLVGNPETMILSSYTIRDDQIVFYKTGEELEIFEGLGVVTDWTLEIPKPANNMNYQTITDIKLVIYYTARIDHELRNLDLHRRPKENDAYQGFSMRFQFPDGFYHFNNDLMKAKIICADRARFTSGLDVGTPSQEIRQVLEQHGVILADSNVATTTISTGSEWLINDPDNNKTYSITARGEVLEISDSNADQHWAMLNFEMSDAYFPTNQENRRIANINIVLASAEIPLPESMPFTLCSAQKEGGAPTVASANFTRQDGFNHVQASSNVGVLEPDGTPTSENPLNIFEGQGMNREWRLQLNLNPSSHPSLFSQNDAGELVPDLSMIGDVLFFVEYRYDHTELTIIEHFEDSASNWSNISFDQTSPWTTVDNKLQGITTASADVQSRLDIDEALKRFPEEIRNSLKQSITDNVMIAFRTMVSDGINDDNDSQFYFADGNYLLSLGRIGAGTQLSRLSTPFDRNTATILADTNDQNNLLIPSRWYGVEIGKFGGRIDVSIDGVEVFNEVDAAPGEGAGIAVGTSGTGKVYFDDILI